MMESFKGYNLLLLLVLVAGMEWVGVEGAPAKNDTKGSSGPECIYTSDMGPLLEKVFDTCKQEIKVVVPEFHAPIEEIEKYYESVAKNDFNDKCFSKCLMDKMNLLTPAGVVDLKVVEKLSHGGNLTESIRKIILKEWTTCNTKIEKDFPGTGDEQKLCRKAVAIEICLLNQAKDIDIPCP